MVKCHMYQKIWMDHWQFHLGSGGSWGKFVKKEKGAKIDFTNFKFI